MEVGGETWWLGYTEMGRNIDLFTASFLGGSVVKKKKKSTCSAGDAGSVSGLGRSPEKEMANHSSTLAWEIPWTVEPGGLWSTGSQRVRHDLMTKQQHVNYLVFKIAKKKKKVASLK